MLRGQEQRTNKEEQMTVFEFLKNLRPVPSINILTKFPFLVKYPRVEFFPLGIETFLTNAFWNQNKRSYLRLLGLLF